MYRSAPNAYWLDGEAEQAHIIDSYGEPGPVVRKPLCVETDHEAFLAEDAAIPDGVWVEGRGSQLETGRFKGDQPVQSTPEQLCPDCKDEYFNLLWKRPVDYPAVEVTVRNEDGETTYVVSDVTFTIHDESHPSVEIMDEMGRTKRLPVELVTEIVPHASMPVVY